MSDTRSKSKPRFPVVLTALTAVSLVALISLGVWQVERLQWKEGLIAASAEAEAQPPAPVDEVLASAAPEFRKVLVLCRGLNTAPFVELRSIEEGQPGFRLISACPLANGQSILIDRGFVGQDITSRPVVGNNAALPVSFTGVVRKPIKPSGMTPPPEGNVFFGRDPAAMAEVLGVKTQVSPWIIYAATPINPEIEGLHPSVPPAAFSNNHAGYAATWFGLAVVLIGVYIGLLRRRLMRTADLQGNTP